MNLNSKQDIAFDLGLKYFSIPEESACDLNSGVDNKTKLFVCYDAAVSEDREALMRKIVASTSIPVAETSYIALSAPMNLFKLLKDHRTVKYVLTFGVAPQLLGLNVDSNVPIAHKLDSVFLVMAPSLESLNTDANLKSHLWKLIQEYILKP